MTIHDYPCDVCGAGDAAPIDVTRHYTKGEPIAVCRNCGFVYASRRPSPAEIADAWATQVYSGKFEDGAYTARGIPAVRARHVYVAEFINGMMGLKDKETVDIGAGEGVFMQLLAGPDYGAKSFGIELSEPNCRLVEKAGFPCFKGTVEEYLAAPGARTHAFDRATVVWTLENTSSCSSMMQSSHKLLKEGGYLTVATSSRVLVPFKKPMHYYMNTLSSALHPFFFSANALRNLFTNAGFKVEHVNRFIDTDYLVMAGKAEHGAARPELVKDDWREVINFYERWHEETKNHYAGT